MKPQRKMYSIRKLSAIKMCLIFILLIIECLATAEDEWKEQNNENFNVDPETAAVGKPHWTEHFNKCANDGKLMNLLRKKSYNDPKFASFYQTWNLAPCSCGVDYHLLDLGRNYYPRFIATGTCKRTSCGPMHHCTEKHYKVKVLKEKNSLTSPSPEEMPKLQDYWNSEIINVVVACECSQKNL